MKLHYDQETDVRCLPLAGFSRSKLLKARIYLIT
jgi:hypothetical protein